MAERRAVEVVPVGRSVEGSEGDGRDDLPANPYPAPERAHAERDGYPFAGKPNKLSDEAQLGGRENNTFSHGPVFMLWASDLIAPSLVRLWADLMVHDQDCTAEQRTSARRMALEMEQWQKNRGMVPPVRS